MNIFARKTVLSKWMNASVVAKDDVNMIPADVITSELRTSENTLSVWKIEQFKDDVPVIDDIVIALLTGSKVQKIETFGLVFIDGDKYKELNFNQVDGDTKVKDLAKLHYDITDMNYKKLGELSIIYFTLLDENQIYKVAKADIKNILKEAFQKQKVSINDFSEKVRGEVSRLIAS